MRTLNFGNNAHVCALCCVSFCSSSKFNFAHVMTVKILCFNKTNYFLLPFILFPARQQCTRSSRRVLAATTGTPKINDKVSDFRSNGPYPCLRPRSLPTTGQKWNILCPWQCVKLYNVVQVSWKTKEKKIKNNLLQIVTPRCCSLHIPCTTRILVLKVCAATLGGIFTQIMLRVCGTLCVYCTYDYLLNEIVCVCGDAKLFGTNEN